MEGKEIQPQEDHKIFCRSLFTDWQNGVISFEYALTKYSEFKNLQLQSELEILKTRTALGDLAAQNCVRLEKELEKATELLKDVEKWSAEFGLDAEIYDKLTTFLKGK